MKNMNRTNLNLSTLTMNASGILISKLREYLGIFDNIFVCDGNLTDEAKKFYSTLPSSVHVIDMPWDDIYVSRYQETAQRTKEGDYILHLDDDEVASESLLGFLKERNFDPDINMYWLPCILHIEDGGKYYPVESEPKQNYEDQWVKRILYRKTPSLNFYYGGSHVIPVNEPHRYIPFPYHHLKTLESFVYNDVWQAFLYPPGQGYNPIETAQFKMFTKQYRTTNEFKNATKEGTWPEPLKLFAWEHMEEFDRPISRLAWVYSILEGHELVSRDYFKYLTWEEVKPFVLSKESMDLLKKNKEKKNYIEI